MQNRKLQTWLREEEYKQIAFQWKEQLELLDEFKQKPSGLKRYGNKLKQAIFNYNCPAGFSGKSKQSTV